MDPGEHRIMKRQSIAEQTLAKQLRKIKSEMDYLDSEQLKLTARFDTLHSIKREIELEIERLQTARTAASAKAKQP
jgi:prefoldin subunit 5